MKRIQSLISIAVLLLFTACTPTNIAPTGGGTNNTTSGTTPTRTTTATITVKGSHIITSCGDTIVLKGVNYAAYSWGWNNNENLFPEIAKSGANAVRIVWYKTNSGPAYSNMALLDSALARCIKNKMIPILELHDETCNNNSTSMIATANWYTQTAVKNILIKYQKWVIINPLNEAGYVLWNGNNATALNTFKTTYKTIITNLRNAGLNMPLLLDASDCGQHLNVWKTISTEMQTYDPKHNLIFSAHAYWSSYAGTAAAITTLLQDASTWNVPIVLGEVANKQDDNNGNCTLPLDLSTTLQKCEQYKIGWLAWVWTADNCGSRQMTTNGNFNALTSYGNQLINTSPYGLKFAKRPDCF